MTATAPARTFYLGTHEERWLKRPGFPLFVSHRRLLPRGRLPRAARDWCLDSGGFTELTLHGRWVTGPAEYVAAVRLYMDRIGRLVWAAPQDWMCEPFMLAKTGLTVRHHQNRTVDNFCQLVALAPEVPFMPVLQGWTLADYEHCLGLYRRAGINLAGWPTVGLGSVCRRQSTDEITEICRVLAGFGLNLHGFGVKAKGLRRCGRHLVSADSMAWSYDARRNAPLPGCTHSTCANCDRWAARWRRRLLAGLPDWDRDKVTAGA